jgi:hypothetical protein
VSPNAITAKTLNALTSATSVIVRVYASLDNGTTWFQILAGTITGGTLAPVVDPDSGQTISTPTVDVLGVSAAPGEIHKVTAQMVTTAAVINAGVGVTVVAQ